MGVPPPSFGVGEGGGVAGCDAASPDHSVPRPPPFRALISGGTSGPADAGDRTEPPLHLRFSASLFFSKPFPVKSNSTFSEIAGAIRAHQRFVVMSHRNPDGDAIGCSLAMALALRGLGKEVTVWNEHPVPEKFQFLPGAELMRPPPATPEEFDVAIVLDNADQVRVGTSLPAVRRAGVWINMDHHVSNPRYGDLAYVDPIAPAAGQVLYEFFEAEGFEITREIADNLYVAISTDTGSFRYPSTTARTYRIAAELIAAGAKVGELAQRVYESYPRRRLELVRAVLNQVRFTANDRVSSITLSLATVAAVGSKPEDTEDLIDYIRAVDTVIAAAYFEEQVEGKVRISLRSKDPRVDVSKVCGQFGGGGHILAAGARIAGTLEQVQERVLAVLAEEVAKLPAGA